MAVRQNALDRLYNAFQAAGYLGLSIDPQLATVTTTTPALVVSTVGPASVTVGGKPYWSQAALDAWIVANAGT